MIVNDTTRTLKEFHDVSVIGVDIETTGLNAWRDRIAVVSFASPDKETAVCQVPGGYLDDNLRDLFKIPNVQWITHNGTGFDLLFFLSQGVELKFGMHYDTLIGEQVLGTVNRHDVRRDLGSTMKRRLGRNSKGTIDHTTWQDDHLDEAQLEYAAADVEYLVAIKDVQIDLAYNRGLKQALEKEQKLTTIVAQIAHNGMAISKEELVKMQERFLEQAAEAQARLPEHLNVNSPKQVKEFLHSKGIMVESTSKDILIMRSEPECHDILTVRPALKRSGFYDDSWLDKYVVDDRVRTRYRQLGTDTTRFSSADPNLQQIPRDMRGMFGHEEGKHVVAVDYAQLELRIAAHLSQDQELIGALESEDIHEYMAQVMMNRKEVTKVERRDGKAGTFTWIFYGGVFGIQAMGRQQGIDIPEEKANSMLRRLRSRFRGVTQWHNTSARALSRRPRIATVVLPWGHQRQFLSKDQRVQRIVNTQVQGRAAIGLKEALFEIHKRGLDRYIGGLVHDEIVATSVPERQSAEFAAELGEAMVVGMTKVCDTIPITVDTDIGSYWVP